MRTLKPIFLFLLVAFAGLILVRCQKTDLASVTKNSTAKSGARIDGTCGTETVCPLWAGQTINAGTLSVENNATTLFVTYTTTGTFNVLHLWVGTDMTLLPTTPTGNPIPGQFPYSFDAAGTQTHTFEIPLNTIPFPSDPKCGPGSAPIYVVAHAEVNVLNGGKETAFGGCTAGATGARWYFYTTHTVQCCDGTPPPVTREKLGTAFAKGGWVFTTDPKSNPENLPSLKLIKNRWGWAINIKDPGIYTSDLWVGAGLNKTAKALKVGTVSIVYDGTQATITYTLTGSYAMEEAHIYAGDLKPTTTAPGQYGNTFNFAPFQNSLTTTISNLTDTNGDGVWIIAHAVVWGPGVTNTIP
jgi:hypothetical protein